MKVLIIEDEKKASRELKMVIEEVRPDANVTNILESVEEGIKWLADREVVDLIFSDIQLSDGLCFEIFRNNTYPYPVIFCTAYSDFIMDAFSANGIYYILKPITKQAVEESFRKFEWLKESFNGRPEYIQMVEKMVQQVKPSYKASLLVSHRDKIIPVKTTDIAFFYYSNGIIHVHLQNQEFHITEVLEELEKTLNPAQFFRANRQFIINRNFVHEIERYFSRKLVVKMRTKTPEAIIISKVKSQAFLSWIESAVF